MSAYGHTLYLDPDRWDLSLDGSGRIKVARGDYAAAQDTANAARLFTDDAYYDPGRGIPHFLITLGKNPAVAVLRARLREAALRVDGVTDAVVTQAGIGDRVLGGEIQLTLRSGGTANVEI